MKPKHMFQICQKPTGGLFVVAGMEI
jgi:hypothetical protein